MTSKTLGNLTDAAALTGTEQVYVVQSTNSRKSTAQAIADLGTSQDNMSDGTTNKNYTATEKNKLAGIATGAEVNVSPDWNATTGDGAIQNKPTLGTAAAEDTTAFATAAQGSLADSSVQSIVAGTGISVDSTDPANPKVTALVRELLTAARTYYVATTGSDTNDGLTAGTAFLTVQKAVDVISGMLDIGAYKVTIQIGPGTYTDAVVVTGPWVGSGDVELTGDTTTPSNCTLSVAGVALTVQSSGRLLMKGMKLTNSAGRLVIVTSFGYLKLSGKNEFGASAGICMSADSGRIDAISEELLSGNAGGAHYYAVNDGVIYCQSAIWTATTPIAIGQSFASVQNGSIYSAFATYSGTFTCMRYSATLNGVINTNGGGASYFPGSTAGSVATGGQYA